MRSYEQEGKGWNDSMIIADTFHATYIHRMMGPGDYFRSMLHEKSVQGKV